MSEERGVPVVERIAHPGSSPEGTNSTYVLPERGLVVDPGPPGGEAWETLVAGIRASECSITDVEAVLVTHWHADHAGLAPQLAEEADAELILHEADALLVGDYAAERERRIERDARRLGRWGVPARIVAAVIDGDEPSPMPDRTPVTAVSDGERIAGVDVVHTPGHTAGHVAVAAGDALLLGYAVLPTYTPNVGGSDTRVDSPLSAYLDALDRLMDLRGRAGGSARADLGSAAWRSFPGHGSTVALRPRIEEIREHHVERLRAVLRALPEADAAENGTSGAKETVGGETSGRTPWQVACELFGEMRGIHAKMGAGEAAAHLGFGGGAGLAVRIGSEPDRYVRAAEVTDEEIVRAVSASRYK